MYLRACESVCVWQMNVWVCVWVSESICLSVMYVSIWIVNMQACDNKRVAAYVNNWMMESLLCWTTEPTYTWGYEEMVSFMKNQIETSITSGAFQDIILEDIVSTSHVIRYIFCNCLLFF
jgi:hypothetical protein